MIYSSSLSITTTTGLAYDHQYNLNSINDPDRTGAGHQPMGHDQWSNFYGRYRVDGARVIASWLNASVYGQMCTILGNNSSTAITLLETANENPLSSSQGMTQTQPAVVLTKVFNLADLNGVTRDVYNADDRYSSQVGSSPSELLILHVVTDTPISLTLFLNIRIEYMVTYFDPVQLTQS